MNITHKSDAVSSYANRNPNVIPNQQDRNKFWARIMFFILVFGTASPVVPIYAKAIVFAALSLPMIFVIKSIEREKLILLFILSLVFLSSMVKDYFAMQSMYSSVTLSLYYIPFCIFVGFLVSCYYSAEQFLKMLEPMMFWMALISLLLFAFFMTFPDLVYSLPIYHFEDSEHRTIGFLNILFAEGFLVVRNTGFASEPGVFQMLLNLALYHNLRNGRSLNFRNAIFIAAILTGLSTAGLIIMCVLIVTFSSKWARLGIAIICIAGGTFVQTVVADQIENKFYGSYAFDKRFIPLTNAVELSLNNPTGIGSVEYSTRLEHSDIGSFDAYTQTVMRYGVQGLMVLIASLLVLLFSAPGIALILSMSYISNSFWFIPIFSCFLFWGVGEIRLTKTLK